MPAEPCVVDGDAEIPRTGASRGDRCGQQERRGIIRVASKEKGNTTKKIQRPEELFRKKRGIEILRKKAFHACGSVHCGLERLEMQTEKGTGRSGKKGVRLGLDPALNSKGRLRRRKADQEGRTAMGKRKKKRPPSEEEDGGHRPESEFPEEEKKKPCLSRCMRAVRWKASDRAEGERERVRERKIRVRGEICRKRGKKKEKKKRAKAQLPDGEKRFVAFQNPGTWGGGRGRDARSDRTHCYSRARPRVRGEKYEVMR